MQPWKRCTDPAKTCSRRLRVPIHGDHAQTHLQEPPESEIAAWFSFWTPALNWLRRPWTTFTSLLQLAIECWSRLWSMNRPFCWDHGTGLWPGWPPPWLCISWACLQTIFCKLGFCPNNHHTTLAMCTDPAKPCSGRSGWTAHGIHSQTHLQEPTKLEIAS